MPKWRCFYLLDRQQFVVGIEIDKSTTENSMKIFFLQCGEEFFFYVFSATPFYFTFSLIHLLLILTAKPLWSLNVVHEEIPASTMENSASTLTFSEIPD